MNEADLKALVIGLVGMLIGAVIRGLWRRYQQKSIKEDIELLKWERQHLEEIKRSSVEMSRSAFRSVFMLAFIAAVGQTVHLLFSFAGIANIGLLVAMAVWAMAAALAFKFFSRYDGLKNYKDSLAKIDEKLEKLERKANKAMQPTR